MKGLVESVKDNGVHQPALVRPREGGGYEIIAGHRRQRASELAGFANMPCIVRNMTDDEAILAMTDDNLRHREKILPMEKVKAKISDQQARLKELEQKHKEAENEEIVDIVRGMSISLEELPLVLQRIKAGDTLGQNVPKSAGPEKEDAE